MFENQVEDYIGKALVEEANGDNNFLSENELAFKVTGMMYADKIKSDGPVSLRSIKGKMSKVRSMCDLKGLMLLPQVEVVENDPAVTGWKIATKDDINYMIETFMGGADPDEVSEPEAESTGAEASE